MDFRKVPIRKDFLFGLWTEDGTGMYFLVVEYNITFKNKKFQMEIIQSNTIYFFFTLNIIIVHHWY